MTVLETDREADQEAPAVPVVDFDTPPDRYRHWRLAVDGDVATVTLAVDEDAGLVEGYALKMNSYDLGVDIELYDAVQRLRFEHPEVKAVVMTGGLEKMFCAGANIRMLAQSSHAWKVNFCKFTNETRNTIEDAHETSGQTWIAALNGTAAGGGYELALACDEIVLIDDGSSTVSLPEVPLLGVLPGTGGLTRVVDKRHVRKDRADLFATKSEGYRGATAVEWGLVDATVARKGWDEEIARRAREAADASARRCGTGITLTPLDRTEDGDTISYPYVTATLDREARRVDITVAGPTDEPPASAASRRASTAGRSRSPARSTTWCCGCAPTSRTSAPGWSAPPATSTGSWRTTRSSATSPTTGSCTRPRSTSSAPSSGSTSPAAAWSR